ncbi:MAG TPA: pseudouridine-5-phosphate glycosidase [Candidatus Atribacteria bacterium]|nr:pseudouridine-5-phosphate glycosidase [Candidatus Atribacteria bacterium]
MCGSGAAGRFLDFKDDVREALENNRPVVALESTIIAHGMPYPENLKVAREVENIIRGYGVVPATIAVMGGKIKIGLSEEEFELLATSGEVIKASRRDLSIVLAKKLTAATTVAATMVAAHLAGIEVFVTGGIGGAHRGAEKTFDVSADLQELARTPVVVVCAGAKSILDLSLTLEYLETMGVPIIGFRTDEFPAFYCRESGLKVDYTVEDEIEAARIIKTKWDLGLKSAIVIANPIPEEYALSRTYVNRIVNRTILEAAKKGIKGKKLTPYLLSRINELSEGKCLAANIELVKNNARVGAKIATAIKM